MTRELLKSLPNGKTEDKSLDWNMGSWQMEATKQDIRREMGALKDEIVLKIERSTHEKVDKDIVAKIDKSIRELGKSLFNFSRETSDIRTSIGHISSVRQKDATEWGNMISSIQKKIDGITSESKSTSSSLEKRSLESEERINQKLISSLESVRKSIDAVSTLHEERINTHAKKYDEQIEWIYGMFDSIDDLFKKIPRDLYEFGAQLEVSLAGKLIGITSLINFKSGFTVVTNGLGVDITATGGGSGSSLAVQSVSGTINGSNKVFTVATAFSSVQALYLAGVPYQPGVDFTATGTTINFTTAPDASLSGEPFWILYSTSGTFYEDTVSGIINGSNMTFTVPNSIANAYTLFLAGISYQPGVDFTTSGTTITMTTAPDASLSGQPFWLLHS